MSYPKCYFCLGQLPALPWYYKLRPGLSVKICDKCYAKKEQKNKEE